MADIFVAPKENETEKASAKPNGQHMNILSSFSYHPEGVTFQNQKRKEIILLFLRPHPITNLSWILLTIVLLILPIIILFFLPAIEMSLFNIQIAFRYILISVLFYYLLIFSYVLVSFLHWFYNVFIVTSERIVDIDYSDIVVHNIALTGLSYVQDTNYTQSGFIPGFLNYGDLFVQTAGAEVNFEAYSIPKPREAVHIIGELARKNKEK